MPEEELNPIREEFQIFLNKALNFKVSKMSLLEKNIIKKESELKNEPGIKM